MRDGCKKAIKKQAFSLVEVLIVIILIAILSGLLLVSLRTPHEDAEAQRLAHHLKMMKSAYIAYYADTHKYLPNVASADRNSPLAASLDRYAVKSIDNSFGSITIRESPAKAVFIGFVGGYTVSAFDNAKLYSILRERSSATGIKGENGGDIATNGPILIQVR